MALGAKDKIVFWLSHGKFHAERAAGAMDIMIRDGSPDTQEAELGIALCALEEATRYLKLAAGAMPEPKPHWAEQDEPKWADDGSTYGLDPNFCTGPLTCQVCGKEQVVCRCDADYAREQAEYDNIDTGGK